MKLFDILDKQNELDEEKILKAFPGIQSSTISNYRANLYDSLLSSLKLLKKDDSAIRIKDLISYADVLHDKGLYGQSLKQLARAKSIAVKNQMDILRLEIVELEKRIETRYVTGSKPERAQELTKESRDLRSQFYFSGSWSDLSLELYDYYLKFGHVTNKEEADKITRLFKSHSPDQADSLGSDSIFYFQSFVWYHHIIQSFPLCYKYSKRWCEYFERQPGLLKEEPEMYIRGYHNMLSSLFFCDKVSKFRDELNALENFIAENEKVFNENQLIQSFTYVETARLNLFFLEGKFTEGAEYCREFDLRLEERKELLDVHRMMIFQYKMACLKFGSGDFHGSLRHLNLIVNNPTIALKEDIQSYARFLSLIVHYELGNDDLIYFQIKSTYRFMLKLKNFQKVHEAIFKFLRQSIYIDRETLIPSFKNLRDEFLEITKDKYERRPLLYLDMISWLESKIDNRPVEEIIREKKVDLGA